MKNQKLWAILCCVVLSDAGCAPRSPSPMVNWNVVEDSIAARRLFERNIDAIHKRDREKYLSSYIHSQTLARNGPSGLQLGFEGWSATRDSTWPDTLIASNLRVVPVAPGIVFGTYCYTVTEHDTTASGVSERVFVKTSDGWRIAVSTAFGLPAGNPPQCK